MADKKIVVVQLSGGNDYLNCVIPYNNPDYVDNRPNEIGRASCRERV